MSLADVNKHDHHTNVNIQELHEYIARVQSFAIWYIEAATYADLTDERWTFYFLYVR
jgi:hypothetical protein